jgi:hypothetical protein
LHQEKPVSARELIDGLAVKTEAAGCISEKKAVQGNAATVLVRESENGNKVSCGSDDKKMADDLKETAAT